MEVSFDSALGAVRAAGIDRPVCIQRAFGSCGVRLYGCDGRAVHPAAVGHAKGIASIHIPRKEGDFRRRRFAADSRYTELAGRRRLRFLKAVDTDGACLYFIWQRDLESALHLKQPALPRSQVTSHQLHSVCHGEHPQSKLAGGKGEFERLVRFDECQRVVALPACDALRIVGRAHVGSAYLIKCKHLAVTALEILIRVVRDIPCDLLNILRHIFHPPQG